jgi:hypothetical protein
MRAISELAELAESALFGSGRIAAEILDKLPLVSQLPVRQLAQQHMTEIRQAFAAVLATRLGRSAEDIHDEGLGAGDFKLDESVELELADGSTMFLRYAFAVMDEAQGAVAIFSEHSGYFFFAMADLVLTARKGDQAIRHVW